MDALHAVIQKDFNALEINEETADGFAGDFDARAAFGFGHTAAPELTAGDRTPAADCTNF